MANQEAAIMGARMASKPNCKPQEVINLYSNWALNHKYDQELCEKYYTGPAACAQALKHYLSTSTDISILDVGAGTGQVGEQLYRLGYRNIDALEPSPGMMDSAQTKAVYQNHLPLFFTSHVEGLDDNSYDAIVMCGAFMEGHIKCDAVKELCRCTKPGGIVVIAMRYEYLWTVEEYRDRLEPEMDRLVREKIWQPLDRKTFPRYFYDYNGVLYVFRVL